METFEVLLSLLIAPILSLFIPLLFVGLFWLRPSSKMMRISVVVITLLFVFDSGALLVAHQLAQLDYKGIQNEEWQRGARDTRNVIYFILPGLAFSFLSVGTIALLSLRRSVIESKDPRSV